MSVGESGTEPTSSTTAVACGPLSGYSDRVPSARMLYTMRCPECERRGRRGPVLAVAVSEDSFLVGRRPDARVAVFRFANRVPRGHAAFASATAGDPFAVGDPGGLQAWARTMRVLQLLRETQGQQFREMRTSLVEVVGNDRFMVSCPAGHRTQLTRAAVVRRAAA